MVEQSRTLDKAPETGFSDFSAPEGITTGVTGFVLNTSETTSGLLSRNSEVL